ncbi:hypothetical protein, partial [Stutzerimonas nitrititolerans]|uniref:hypothetical protein n=1 Tax=Stutzerimonas nitrititolerans TaxID=2482751 RepID=UPI0035E3F577
MAVQTEPPLSLISTLMVLPSSAYRTALETMFETARLSIDLSPCTDPSPESAISTAVAEAECNTVIELKPEHH